MNTELHSQEHRLRRLIAWAAFYVLIFLLFIAGLYFAATQIRTHTLPVGQIKLSIPHSQYVVGEPITFQIINNLNAPIYVVNKCPAEPLAVYYNQGGVWLRIHSSSKSIKECPDENRQEPIAANSVRNGSFQDWAALFAKPGQYRIVAIVEQYNALPYQDFEVITPPAPAPVVKPATSTPTFKATTPTSTTTKKIIPTVPTQPRNREPNDD
jgi:hypothetical protein